MILPENPVDLPDNRIGFSQLPVMVGIPALVTAKFLVGSAM